MASVVSYNELKAIIDKIDKDLIAHIDSATDDIVKEVMIAAEAQLAIYVTCDAKSLALLSFIQRLIPHAISQSKAQKLYLKLIEDLLAQPNIQLVLYPERQAPYSILYELVLSTRDCEAALPLLQTYLARVASPEAVILQKITNPADNLQTTDMIQACITDNNTKALALLLPYIIEDKDACWARLIQSNQEDCIKIALTSNWLSLADKNKYLRRAALTGNNEIIKLLLNNGAEINHTDQDGYTAFRLAAEGGHCTTIELLLDYGANINHTDHLLGETALILAARAGRHNIVELLLNRGADINHTDEYGTTALIDAAENGHRDVVELLLDRGANSNHTELLGQTALICAASAGYHSIVELLLDKGSDINHADQHGNTAFIEAAERGHPTTVELLLNRGANIHQVVRYGRTALIKAARASHHVIVKLLLDRGADINHTNEDGNTALMVAAENEQLAISQLLLNCKLATVELLLNRGANINITNNQGKTAVELAHPACASLLEEHSSKLNVRPRPR